MIRHKEAETSNTGEIGIETKEKIFSESGQSLDQAPQESGLEFKELLDDMHSPLV